MINYNEGVKKHITDTLTHKQYFTKACLKMLDYLYSCDRYEDALELAKRCSMHDHSKLEMDEVKYFVELLSEEDENHTPNGRLTDKQKKLIELHWKRNRHHPEFFSDCNKMSDIDIIEMVCDWAARSEQYNNSLIEFAHRIQSERFHFSNERFDDILKYCSVLE